MKAPNLNTLFCQECEITHLNVHAKFPSNSPMYSTEKQKLSLLIENSNGGKLKEVCGKLQPNLKRLLNEGFPDKNGKTKKVSKKDLKNLSLEISEVLDNTYQENSNNSTSFYESYTKSKQLEPKKNYKEKRTTERQMFKKVVDKIQDQNDSNCVNRLYGADISLRGWDLEIKRKSFETVEDAQTRTAEENAKIESGKKRTQITQAI